MIFESNLKLGPQLATWRKTTKQLNIECTLILQDCILCQLKKMSHAVPLLSSIQWGTTEGLCKLSCLVYDHAYIVHTSYSFNPNAEMSVLTFIQRMFSLFCLQGTMAWVLLIVSLRTFFPGIRAQSSHPISWLLVQFSVVGTANDHKSGDLNIFTIVDPKLERKILAASCFHQTLFQNPEEISPSLCWPQVLASQLY